MGKKDIFRRLVIAIIASFVVPPIGSALCKYLLIYGDYYAYGVVDNVELSSGERNISFEIYTIRYRVGSQEIVEHYTCSRNLSVGDTVKIRYSKIFPDLSVVSM